MTRYLMRINILWLGSVLMATLILLPSAAMATHTDEIRVLILDKGFNRLPGKNETLKKVDDVDGRLVLGYDSYLGKLSIWRGKSGLYLVNSIPLEDYVKGVVKAETGRDWAEEALKTQSVIVRTYVLSKVMSAKRKEYHVTSSVLHQVYKGLNANVDVEVAVNSTIGEVLTYEDKPIVAYYHSTSVGATENAEDVFGDTAPYLKSVTASGRLSPYAFWKKRVTLHSIASAVGLKNAKEIKILSRTKSGRADDIQVTSKRGKHKKVVKAKNLRRLLGWRKLPSTDFTVYLDKTMAVFEGKGYGHGVGLCQWTALEMALEGTSYKDILAHFYPGAEITSYDAPGTVR